MVVFNSCIELLRIVSAIYFVLKFVEIPYKHPDTALKELELITSNNGKFFISFRLEIEQLRTGHKSSLHIPQQHNNQQKNDHLTLKWLSNAMSEMKNELAEIQLALNATIILQNKEETEVEMSLLRTDIANLNKDLEVERSRNARYEATMNELKEEILSLRDDVRSASVLGGKLKNQVMK